MCSFTRYWSKHFVLIYTVVVKHYVLFKVLAKYAHKNQYVLIYTVVVKHYFIIYISGHNTLCSLQFSITFIV